MKDKRLLYLLGAGTLTGLAGTAGAQQQRPNIIYMMADQLRADVLGYAGDGLAVTPNIDRFARQSLDFTNAVSVSPVSAAYRASLITGKYTSSTGMVINELNLNPNHRTLAHVLTDAGYQTGYVGKVHWNDAHRRPYKPGPERMGFDGYWAAYSFNHINYSAFYDTDGPDGEPVHVDLKGQYGPEVFTGLALDYIREHAGDEQPFTLMLSWSPTHDPWVRRNVPAHCYERFKDVKFELPENFNENPDPYMDRFFSEYFNGRTSWRDDFVKGEGYQEAMRCYYAMVNSIDEQFGRVVELLDSLGIADNTIVVFTSDHGEMMTSQGRMFKMIFYDEACRIPFLIRCPGGEEGTDGCLPEYARHRAHAARSGRALRQHPGRDGGRRPQFCGARRQGPRTGFRLHAGNGTYPPLAQRVRMACRAGQALHLCPLSARRFRTAFRPAEGPAHDPQCR